MKKSALSDAQAGKKLERRRGPTNPSESIKKSSRLDDWKTLPCAGVAVEALALALAESAEGESKQSAKARRRGRPTRDQEEWHAMGSEVWRRVTLGMSFDKAIRSMMEGRPDPIGHKCPWPNPGSYESLKLAARDYADIWLVPRGKRGPRRPASACEVIDRHFRRLGAAKVDPKK